MYYFIAPILKEGSSLVWWNIFDLMFQIACCKSLTRSEEPNLFNERIFIKHAKWHSSNKSLHTACDRVYFQNHLLVQNNWMKCFTLKHWIAHLINLVIFRNLQNTQGILVLNTWPISLKQTITCSQITQNWHHVFSIEMLASWKASYWVLNEMRVIIHYNWGLSCDLWYQHFFSLNGFYCMYIPKISGLNCHE